MSETTKVLIKYNSRIIMKHDTDENWSKASGFIPLAGELIVYDTSKRFKIGDGITNVINLPFSSAGELTNYLGYEENGQNYPVEKDSKGKLFVNVPWTDTDNSTVYYAGTGLQLKENKFYLDNDYLVSLPGEENAHSGLVSPVDKYNIDIASMAINQGIKGKTKNLYKFGTTSYGMVSNIEPITADDIIALGIVSGEKSNTAGATQTSTKIFIVGSNGQGAVKETYTNSKAYILDGHVYSDGYEVLTKNSEILNTQLTELLGSDGLILSNLLPSYVDDVIEGKYYDDTAIFVASDGNVYEDSGKIFVDIETNKTYRWGGKSSGFIEISASLALGETAQTAFRGDHGKTAYEHAIQGNNCYDYDLGWYKIQTTNGHITKAEEVTRNDIVSYGLGYEAGEGIIIDNELGLISINNGYYASADVAGLMDSSSYRHLWSIEAGANKYVLPMATSSTLGGIKVGANLVIDTNGVLSGDYPTASFDNDGLMSAVYYTNLIRHVHKVSYTPEATVTFAGDEVTTNANTEGQIIMAITDSNFTKTVNSEYGSRCLKLTSAALTSLGVSLANHTHKVTPTGNIIFEGKTAQLITDSGYVPV